MKILKFMGALCALLFALPLFAKPFVINDDKILNEQVSSKLETIGTELAQKTGINLAVAVYENLGTQSLQDAFNKQNLNPPFIFLILEKAHKKVEIFADEQSEKLFNKEQVLSPFPESGTILPILVSNKGKDVYNAALLNGYADIAEQVAKSKGIKLENSIGNANKNVLNALRIFFYASIFLAVCFMIYKRKVKMAKNTTFWPYGITLSIIGCVALCIATIWVSLDYPVEMDQFYLEKYQNVNQDINEIKAKQREFEAKFDVKLLTKEFKILQDKNIQILLTPKSDEIGEIKYEILLTRPETNAYNTKLDAKLQHNVLTTSEISPVLEGRWQIMVKFTQDNLVGFYKMEFLALK